MPDDPVDSPEKNKRELLRYLLEREGLPQYSPLTRNISKRREPGKAPLSFAQERLWFLDQLEANRSPYNILNAFGFKGRLDAGVLYQSLMQIARRHEVLRSTIQFEGDFPVQRVNHSGTLTLPVISLGELPEHLGETESLRIGVDQVHRRLDLETHPWLKFSLIEHREDEHLLILVIHQGIYDWSSVGILLREIALWYESLRERRVASLPALPLQFGDFAAWQRETLNAKTLEPDLQYWRHQLAGILPVLNLPTDRPRPPLQSYHGAKETIRIPRDQTIGLEELSRHEGVTPFTMLMAVFNTLLYRYSGQDDIIVGFPVSTREGHELENLMGFFVNTLVLRTDLSGKPTFRELLGRLHRTTLDAYAHQNLPFEKLVEELDLERELSRNPLFQVMLVLHPVPRPSYGLPGLTISFVESDAGLSKFDLTLALARDEDGLVGTLEYSTDLFDRLTIQRMIVHLATLLTGIVQDPNRPVSELPILTEHERHQLLVDWNDTARAYPKDQCVHELFEAAATRTPDRTAVVFDDGHLTYRELNSRSNQLAHHLRNLGVGPETLVGVSADRSLEMPIALLGILKTGGAYVPLDPTYPEERIDYMIRDSGIEVMVAGGPGFGTRDPGLDEGEAEEIRNSSSVSRPPSPVVRQVHLDSDQPLIQQLPTDNLASSLSAANLAYVIYTSGSTGEPKGAKLEHRNTVAMLNWAASVYGPAELPLVVSSTSICFDLSIFEIFVPLTLGGAILLVDNVLQSSEVTAFAEATLLNTVPSAIAELVGDHRLPDSLVTVNLAGEALSPELVRDIYEKSRARSVWDLYGPSECTTYSTFALRAENGPATVGKPISNTQTYILDKNMAPVPIGVEGEIHIGGCGVARGYGNRAALTAERFVPDPFGKTAGARLYATGDAGRYLHDGNIEYRGRFDQQVKIRGYRIEPGEIEAALRQHPAIADTVVIPHLTADVSNGATSRTPDTGHRTPFLLAYLVPPENSPEPDPETLRQFLGNKLPGYMIPNRFICLKELPRTPNGKLDRAALPSPDGTRPDTPAPFVAPRNEIEELVAQVWRDVLKFEEIGVHDNFFELGGHSLMAIQIVSRLRHNFGVELSVKNLFQSPTVAGLATTIERLRQSGETLIAAPMTRVARDPPIPLSFAQQRVWFLHQLDPNLTAYNMPSAFHLEGDLDASALAEAFEHLLARHESLRTTFSATRASPRQIIADTASFSLPMVDLQQITKDGAHLEAQRLARVEQIHVFDLTAGPLLRVMLLRLEPDEHVLILNVHHMICDGWSLGLLFRELPVLYQSALQGRPPKLPELPVQYADFAVWQRAQLTGDLLDAQLSYWTHQLQGLQTLKLPGDRSGPPAPAFDPERVSLELSTALTRQMKDLSRSQGVTLFMTLLAAVDICLVRWSGQTDIAVGSTIAGRSRPEIEKLIGFFINAFVLRTELSEEEAFTDLLGKVRDVCLSAYAHADLPFERIVQELQPHRDTSRNPLFQVMFNMQHLTAASFELEGLAVERLPYLEPEAKFDLTLYAPEKDGAIQLVAVYNESLFNQSLIRALLEEIAYILSQAVEQPAKRVNEFSLSAPIHSALIPDPTEALDDTWHGAIHELLEARNLEDPDRIAIVESRDSWSYREIGEASNRIANYLAEDDIGREDIVAIYAHRNATLVCALFGVLKAGAAFLILDAAHPPKRSIEYVRIARPKGWLQMTDAGPLPAELEEALSGLSIGHPFELPGEKGALFDSLAGFRRAGLIIATQPDDLAYVAFTSGSTGEPKAVLGRHGPITHFLPWQNETFGLSAADRFCLLSGLSYNHLQRDIFTPLAIGATLYIPSDEEMQSPHRLADWLNRNEISVMLLTPALGRVLQELPADPPLPTLGHIFFGGDVLRRADIEAFTSLAPNARIISFYGATETQRAVGYHAVTETPGGVVPLGKGVPDVQLLVMNSSGQLSGIGELGEIFVRSPHLARGYLGDEELTAERFIHNPFTNLSADRLYRTGDLGRYLSSGEVEFAGRTENQLSIRSFRMNPREIESVLLGHAGCADAYVTAREFEAPARSGAVLVENRLVAYVVPKTNVTITANELRDFLSERLPNHMVPSHFELLDALPLNASGKVEETRLPGPDTREDRTGTRVLPRNETELALAKIWCEVIGIEEVGVYDDFFELGGHSLLATMVQARIREQFEVEVALRVLIEKPRIAQIAQLLSRLQDNGLEILDASDREEFEL